MPEEEFLGELAEKTTSVTIEEFTAEGVRMTYNLQGRMRGLYEADHLETVDAVFRPDGTYVFEQRGIDQTDKGEMILIRAKGTGTPVSPTAIQAQGEATFQTMSKELEWLNSATGRFEGTYNTKTGEFVAKVFSRK